MSTRKQKKREQKKQARKRKARTLRQQPFGRGEVVILPEGAEKMSEVLTDFIEPYADLWKTEDELYRLLDVASVAWNAALMSGEERDKLIRDSMGAVPPEVRADLKAILTNLIRRKETYFASNKRIILSYEVTMGPDEYRVNVLSTYEGP
jgi:hypothetical protein